MITLRTLIFLLILVPGLAHDTLAAGSRQEENTISTPGAVFHFPSGRRDTALRYLRVFPEVRMAVRRLTGSSLENPVTVELVRDSDELSARTRSLGGRPPDTFIEGLAFSGRRHILIRLDAGGTAAHRVEGLLTHELVHVAVHEYRNLPDAAPIPRWLDEGIAQFAEGRPVTELFWDLSVRARFGALISLSELDDAFLGDPGRRATAYVQAESLIRFIAKAGLGSRSLRDLLELLGKGEPLDLALRRITFMEFDELERRWIDHLKSDVAATLKTVGPLFFAVFVGLASVVIMIRRHRRRLFLEERWAREEEELGDQSDAETSST